jgi:outer membrane protein assembly factor BamB
LTVESGSPTEAGDFTGLVAISRQTGEISWKYSVANAYSYPTVVGNTVFVQGETLVALDRRTGERQWATDTGFAAGLTAPVHLGGEILVTAAGLNGVRAFDAETGRATWETEQISGIITDLAMGGGDGYIGLSTGKGSGTVAVLNPSSGKIEGRTSVNAGVQTIAVDEDTVYALGDESLTAISRSTRDVSWTQSFHATLPRRSGIAVGSDRVFSIGATDPGERRLYAVSKTDGKIEWRGVRPASLRSGPLTVDGDAVFVPVETNSGHALRASHVSTGERIEQWSLIGTPTTGIALDDEGGVYVTQNDETVVLASIRERMQAAG